MRRRLRRVLQGVAVGVIAIGMTGLIALVGWRQGGQSVASQTAVGVKQGLVLRGTTRTTLVMRPLAGTKSRRFALTTFTRSFDGSWHEGTFLAKKGSQVYLLLNSARQVVRLYQGLRHLTGTVQAKGTRLSLVESSAAGPVSLLTSKDFSKVRLHAGESVQITGYGSPATVVVTRVVRQK